jgi:Mg2+ and Co2+ transporter CorA
MNFKEWILNTHEGTALGWTITCVICLIILYWMYKKLTKGPWE